MYFWSLSFRSNPTSLQTDDSASQPIKLVPSADQPVSFQSHRSHDDIPEDQCVITPGSQQESPSSTIFVNGDSVLQPSSNFSRQLSPVAEAVSPLSPPPPPPPEDDSEVAARRGSHERIFWTASGRHLVSSGLKNTVVVGDGIEANESSTQTAKGIWSIWLD